MPRPTLANHAAAVAAVAAVPLIKAPIEAWVGPGPPLLLFVPALIFSAWLGGLGPGMLATALSVVVCLYLYFPPIGSLLLESGNDALQIGVFLLVGMQTSLLMQQLIDANRQSEASATEAEAYRDTLLRSEARLQAILDHATAIIYLKDVEGRYLVANRRWEQTFGVDRSGVAGETDLDVLPRGVARVFRERDRAAFEAGRATESEDVLPVGDGLRTYLTVRFPLIDATGRTYAIGGFATDITDRKRAEEAMRRERDFAEGLIAAAQAIVLVLDGDGRIVQFNPFFEQETGRGPGEIQGADWLAEFVPAEDRPPARAAFARALAGTERSQVIHRIVAKGGRAREVEWAHRRLPGEPRRILAIGHDITDLREAQRRALQAERLAAIGQMVTGLAHESRNALQRSQACLEMLARRVGDRPDALDLLAGVQEAQDDLHRLYEEVRGYAAPILLDRRPCSLRDVLREAWGRLEPQWKDRDVRLVEEGEPGASCEADGFRIGQVFRNLLDNALDACPDPVAIRVEWSDAEVDGRPAVRVAVEDNGPGLTPEQRLRLFDPFFTTKTQGTGLGLPIARRIVEAHEGTIAVDAREGPGVRIVITLPRGAAGN
jgi:two-component system, LuxR family, sensor kinase FixL